MQKSNSGRFSSWLPVSREEMQARDWNEVDVIIVSGDAYVDHPSFGHAVIGRLLESLGLRVAILPQPNWRDDLRDFKKLGKPRLFFGVTGGCMDSMVNHYTAFKRLRADDAYTPGGKSGFRPDYAVSIYANILKKLFPDTPVILGGVEASLRRTTHYDYWSDALKPGILTETGADMLVYGMGEQAIREISTALINGADIKSLKHVPQTAFLCSRKDIPDRKGIWEDLELPSHQACVDSKSTFGKHFVLLETESNRMNAKRLIQNCGGSFLVINPPFPPMKEAEVDFSYDLPFSRKPHPRYLKRGNIPAYEMIRHSVNIHRGCFGGCSFCTISAHQGKFIVSRSVRSIMKEVETIASSDGFHGHITDLGGPSANMYKMQGADLTKCRKCKRPSCIWPSKCNNLNDDHAPLIDLYKNALKINGVKKVTIGSGIRYDMLCGNSKEEDKRKKYSDYIRQLVRYHVSGRLKIAPEHTSSEVLKYMRKPSFKSYHEFSKLFKAISHEAGLRQEIVPYFISSHPACKPVHMAELAAETKKLDLRLEQVQDFTPTPMTLASVFYYTGFDPYSGAPVFVARSREDKTTQNRFFFWYKPTNLNWVLSRCRDYQRDDLVKVFKTR